MTDLGGRFLEQYIIKDGFEPAVTRRLRYVGILPAVVIGGLASITTWWLLVLFVPLLAFNVWLVNAMYERGWAIYEGSFGAWGKKEEGLYHNDSEQQENSRCT